LLGDFWRKAAKHSVLAGMANGKDLKFYGNFKLFEINTPRVRAFIILDFRF
jgi:hypothetical protein